MLRDSMPASALAKFITFAGEVLFERKPQTSVEPEATLGERIDLRISGQREIPHTEDEKAKTLLVSSLTQQVVNSPSKSTMITDSQKKWITILYHIKIQKLMLNRTATWNDMKSQRSRVVCNAKYA